MKTGGGVRTEPRGLPTGALKLAAVFLALEVGALVLISWFWVPAFREFFAQFGGNLPVAARLVLGPVFLPSVAAVLGAGAIAAALWVRSVSRRETVFALLVGVGLLAIGGAASAVYAPLFELEGNIKS